MGHILTLIEAINYVDVTQPTCDCSCQTYEPTSKPSPAKSTNPKPNSRPTPTPSHLPSPLPTPSNRRLEDMSDDKEWDIKEEVDSEEVVSLAPTEEDGSHLLESIGQVRVDGGKEKASSRSLKHKTPPSRQKSDDSTRKPTISPPPTLTENLICEWNWLTMSSGTWCSANNARTTKYYIYDKSGTRLLQSGTMCGGMTTLSCWMTLPPEGDYIIRLAGKMNALGGASTVDFCGRTCKMVFLFIILMKDNLNVYL